MEIAEDVDSRHSGAASLSRKDFITRFGKEGLALWRKLEWWRTQSGDWTVDARAKDLAKLLPWVGLHRVERLLKQFAKFEMQLAAGQKGVRGRRGWRKRRMLTGREYKRRRRSGAQIAHDMKWETGGDPQFTMEAEDRWRDAVRFGEKHAFCFPAQVVHDILHQPFHGGDRSGRGKPVGRKPSVLVGAKLAEVVGMLEANRPTKEIARETGIARSTIQDFRKRWAALDGGTGNQVAERPVTKSPEKSKSLKQETTVKANSASALRAEEAEEERNAGRTMTSVPPHPSVPFIAVCAINEALRVTGAADHMYVRHALRDLRRREEITADAFLAAMAFLRGAEDDGCTEQDLKRFAARYAKRSA